MSSAVSKKGIKALGRAVASVLLLGLIVSAASPAAAQTLSEAELKAKETLSLKTLGRARRQLPVSLRLGGDSFTLFADQAVAGSIGIEKSGKESWQLEPEAVQQLEQRLAGWLRSGAVQVAQEDADRAQVEVTRVALRAARTRQGTRVQLALRADLTVSLGGAGTFAGVYRFHGRGVLLAPQAPADVLEEGWLPGADGPYLATYRVEGEEAVVGDVVYPLGWLRDFQEKLETGVVVYAAITPRSWPDGRIPYEISDQFDDVDLGGGATQADAIEAAIRHWNQRTKIQLVPRSDETDYLLFVTHSFVCQGQVGHLEGLGAHLVWLAQDCQLGNIIHEIGHIVGLHHEHQRPDRDTWVRFDPDALLDPTADLDNFATEGALIGFYNYRSIMHYSRNAFAAPGAGPTLTPLRDLPTTQLVMGQRLELSKGDIMAANLLATWDPRLNSNPYSDRWLEGFAASAHQYAVADVSNDGIDDLVAFGGSENGVYVARASANHDGFLAAGRWIAGFCSKSLTCLAGDVDGDGRADVVEGETGRVAFASGTKFERITPHTGGIGNFDRFFLADVNGDCRSDLVAVIGGGSLLAEVYVALSKGDGFAPKVWWGDFPADSYAMGDVDGDSKDDFVAAKGFEMFVHLSEGDGFAARAPWWKPSGWFAASHFELADMNGDRREDLVSLSPLSPEYAGRVMVALSTGAAFRSDVVNYHELDCLNQAGCLVADVDDDGRADIVDPASSQRGQILGTREPGDVFVSRSTAFLTDPIGPLKVVLADAVLGERCRRPDPLPAER